MFLFNLNILSSVTYHSSRTFELKKTTIAVTVKVLCRPSFDCTRVVNILVSIVINVISKMSKTAKTVILFVVKLVIVSNCWTTFSLNRGIYCSVTVCKFDHKTLVYLTYQNDLHFTNDSASREYGRNTQTFSTS